MPVEDFIEQTLLRLQGHYDALDRNTGRIHFRAVGPNLQFRHETLSESLVCYLKGIKAISTLNACVILLRHGYAQEVGALCRMVDDFCNEIYFLLEPRGENGFSRDQIRFLEDFFQEEFDKPDDPLASKQKRVNVPVRKIHATFGKVAAAEINPFDSQELLRTTHQAFSGYVHGAYPHIMELFGGNPPRFHTTGMLGTPRIEEWREQLLHYTYRILMTSVFVARKLDDEKVENDIRALVVEFEEATGSKESQPAARMLTEYKQRRNAT